VGEAEFTEKEGEEYFGKLNAMFEGSDDSVAEETDSGLGERSPA
jgi:hypothetical protein